MSNKLKTISAEQYERMIADKIGSYLNEECLCELSNLDVPNVDSEDNPGLHDKRTIKFEVTLSYKE